MKRYGLYFAVILAIGLIFISLALPTPKVAGASSPTSTYTPAIPAAAQAGRTTSNLTIYLPMLAYSQPTQTPTPTETSTPTQTPTPTMTPTPRPAQEFLACSAPGASIPDNTSEGVRSDINLDQWGIIQKLEVFVRITHSWVGDLAGEINQRSTVNHATLFDRPGGQGLKPSPFNPQGSIRCSLANMQAIFTSEASQSVNNKCQSSSMIGVAIGGSFTPYSSLDTFNGSPAAGTYSLLVSDNGAGDTGTLVKWCLHGWAGDVLPAASSTSSPASLPDSAFVTGMSGQNQALPLDCESRSAVDWARHFGTYIDEITFFNQLPTSNNPDKGFVGSVYGGWGSIPPGPYGIHAGPIAALLRAYGLKADGRAGWTYDDLRAEIASGNPVEVWVTGHVSPGGPEFYQVPSGISQVARFEHTVIAYGYTSTSVTILDGGSSYTVSVERFLDAWSSLGNMAVMAR